MTGEPAAPAERPAEQVKEAAPSTSQQETPGQETKPSTQDVMDMLSGQKQEPAPFAGYGLLAQATDATRRGYGGRAPPASAARVSPFRVFLPGESYSPEVCMCACVGVWKGG